MDHPPDTDHSAADADATPAPPGPPTVWQPVEEAQDGDGSWASLLLASLGSTLLGAVLALGILAYLNGGELEFRGAPAGAPASDAILGAGTDTADGAPVLTTDDEADLLVASQERLDLLEAEIAHLTGEVEALHEALGDPPMEVVNATAETAPTEAAPTAAPVTTPAGGGAFAATAAPDDAPDASTPASTRPRQTATAMPDTPEPTAPRPRTPRATATLRISP